MKLCQVIFSTNRPEYLERTLKSQSLFLNTQGFEVTRILIDDMPLRRNNAKIRALASMYGYETVWLHEKNMGIGATWEEFWAYVRQQDFDYIWQQEDDVVIVEPIEVSELQNILLNHLDLSQLVMKRQKWYKYEKESEPLPDDYIWRDKYRCEFNAGHYFFTPIASMYPARWARVDYKGFYRERYPNDHEFHTANINEALIGKCLLEKWGLHSMHVKGSNGQNLIRHIGEYTIGKKVLPGEPCYSEWADLDPEKKYFSGTNIPYKPNESISSR
jgi:hypothetical protein